MKHLLFALFLVIGFNHSILAANQSCQNTNFIKVTIVSSTEDPQRASQVFFSSIAEKFSKKVIVGQKSETNELAVYRYQLDETTKPAKFSAFEYLGDALITSDRNILITANKDKNPLIAAESSFLNDSSEKRYALIFVKKDHQKKELSFANIAVPTADESLKKFNHFVAFPEATGVKKATAGLVVTCTCKGYWGGTSCCTSPSCNAVLGRCQDNYACKQNGSCSEYTSCNCAT